LDVVGARSIDVMSSNGLGGTLSSVSDEGLRGRAWRRPFFGLACGFAEVEVGGGVAATSGMLGAAGVAAGAGVVGPSLALALAFAFALGGAAAACTCIADAVGTKSGLTYRSAAQLALPIVSATPSMKRTPAPLTPVDGGGALARKAAGGMLRSSCAVYTR
jgi:hypothetical protein